MSIIWNGRLNSQWIYCMYLGFCSVPAMMSFHEFTHHTPHSSIPHPNIQSTWVHSNGLCLYSSELVADTWTYIFVVHTYNGPAGHDVICLFNYICPAVWRQHNSPFGIEYPFLCFLFFSVFLCLSGIFRTFWTETWKWSTIAWIVVHLREFANYIDRH